MLNVHVCVPHEGLGFDLFRVSKREWWGGMHKTPDKAVALEAVTKVCATAGVWVPCAVSSGCGPVTIECQWVLEVTVTAVEQLCPQRRCSVKPSAIQQHHNCAGVQKK